MSQLQSGSILGRYELLVRVGRGGMASVWVARERSPQSGRQRLVAVKAMLPELAQQSAFRSMFLEEGQLVRSISHENVVQVHDVGEVDGILYMTMEWVEGESLRNVIRAAAGRRPIPSEIAVQVVSDAAGGLHAAHELRGWDHELRGIVHCDVSPHNVLLGVDGRAKVLDFGVASAMGHLDPQGIKGKPGYMAPEQARGEPLDRRADVFALGIVLYELTTGAPFLPTRDREQALQQASNPQIVPPSSVQADYSPGLEQVVLTSLSPNPSQRYQTAQDLQFALQRYLIEERVLVSPGGVARLLQKVVGQRIERRRELIAAVLREIDGEINQQLMLQHPGLVTHDLWDYQPDSKVNPSSAITLLSATGPAPISSPIASSTVSEPVSEIDADLGSGVPVVPNQALSHVRRGPSTLAISLLVLVVAGAALAVGFLLRGRLAADTAVAEAVNPVSEKPVIHKSSSSTSQEAPAVSGPRGVSIENLPVEAPGEHAGHRPTANAPAHGASKQEARPQGKTKKSARDTKIQATAETASTAENAPDGEIIDGEPAPILGPDEAEGIPAPSQPQADSKAFNRAAASAALQRIAGSLGSCSRPGGPSGHGTATVAFSTSGSVSSVRLPFSFAGTEVGQCIQGRLSGAKVSAFEGGAASVSQGFQVN